MWDQLPTFWSLDRAEKHYSLKEQLLNMPLGSQNPYAKRAYYGTAWTLSEIYSLAGQTIFLPYSYTLSLTISCSLHMSCSFAIESKWVLHKVREKRESGQQDYV